MVINAALVGFGAVARHGHLPWYLNHPTVELTAIVEPTARGRAATQALMPYVPVFSSLDDLLRAQQVTFVDITAQPAAHCELILKAAAAGIHVICEKPFVTSCQALEEIEQVRRYRRPIIAACHNWYFAPAIRRGLEYVAAGIVGEPESVSFAARRPQSARGADHWKPTWRQSAREGGGILGDLGYHGFYLTSRIFQCAPISVQANSIHVADSEEEAESAASVALDYGQGRRAEFTLSWLNPVRETVLQVYGSRGSLIIAGDALRLRSDGMNDIEERFESLTVDSWHAAWIGETLDWFLGEIQRGDPKTCWQDIRWSVSALDAAYASIKSGTAIAMSTPCPVSST